MQENKMAKVTVSANLDYISGYLRYGHLEGDLDIPDEDLELFKEDPVQYILDNDLQYDLQTVVDDYSIDEKGDIIDVSILSINKE